MTKTKSTKHALIMSVMALCLCFTMLLGTTFAWFTDSVTSSSNIIKSGTLDIEMYWAKGTEAPDTATWTDASTGAIFNNDKWEPGYVEVRHIMIENKGTLALKYQISISANGEVSDLSDVIDVYYLDPAQQVGERTELTADKKLGTLTEVLANISTTASGNLAAGENHTITIAMKMQETAGNEYQNKSIGTDFSVLLAATQLDSEFDSFGKDYDAGLLPPNEDGDILVEENGVQYVYTADGEHILYLVTEDYAEDTLVVPEGVDKIGSYSFYYNDNVKNVVLSSTVRDITGAFTESSVENVTLNEGLEEISKNAFKKTYSLQSVTIPSTVKSIGETAFQQTGLKEIVIPANVETLGYQSFVSSQIEKVTIDGDVVIENRAFRGCTKLNTVVLNGDIVEFVNNSAVGACWISNKESNNPNYSNITFYVKNTTVEANVRAALQAELPATTPIYVNGKLNVKIESTEQLTNALTNLTPGTVIDATGVTLEVTNNEHLVISGGGTIKGATFATTSRGGDYIISTSAEGETLVFEDCTFGRSDTGMMIIGAEANGANLVFNNCTFEGAVAPNFVERADGSSQFNNCTFKVGDTGFMKQGFVNCMGGTHTFSNCTFNYTDGNTSGSNQYVKWNAVNSYSESDNSYATVVILDGCTLINCGTQKYGSNSTLTIK